MYFVLAANNDYDMVYFPSRQLFANPLQAKVYYFQLSFFLQNCFAISPSSFCTVYSSVKQFAIVQVGILTIPSKTAFLSIYKEVYDYTYFGYFENFRCFEIHKNASLVQW